MNGSLTTQIQGNLYATLQYQSPTDLFSDTFVQPLAMTLSNGALSGQANSLYSGQFTLAPLATQIFDLVHFGGAVDVAGDTYNNSSIKIFFIQNLNGTIANFLCLSNASSGIPGNAAAPTGNGWGGFWSGNGTNIVEGSNGYILATTSGISGWPIGGGNGTNIAVFNPWNTPTTFNMAVIGVRTS